MSTGIGLTLARKVPSPFCAITTAPRGGPVSHREFFIAGDYVGRRIPYSPLMPLIKAQLNQYVMPEKSVQIPDGLGVRVTPYASVTPNLSSNDGLPCKGRFPEGAPGSGREAAGKQTRLVRGRRRLPLPHPGDSSGELTSIRPGAAGPAHTQTAMTGTKNIWRKTTSPLIAVSSLVTRRGGLVSLIKSFIANQRGAVALEMPAVVLFMMMSLLLPLADLAIAGFRFISAHQALRDMGQRTQYSTPDATDPNSITNWKSSLPTTVDGYPINAKVYCGDPGTEAPCAGTTWPKYYTFETSFTLSPMVLGSMLCGTCTVNYSQRFQ